MQSWDCTNSQIVRNIYIREIPLFNSLVWGERERAPINLIMKTMKLDACASARVEWASDMNWTIDSTVIRCILTQKKPCAGCVYIYGRGQRWGVHSSRQGEWKVRSKHHEAGGHVPWLALYTVWSGRSSTFQSLCSSCWWCTFTLLPKWHGVTSAWLPFASLCLLLVGLPSSSA